MKTAILGAGSLGTIIGALISKGGQDVELIDVNQEHVDALNQSGAVITGTLNETIPVKAITPDQMEGKYDLVLLLTKQLYNKSILKDLLPYLHEKSLVCSLQNGTPEEEVASQVGVERVISGAVHFGATWVKPGVSELTTEYNQFKAHAFDIGELDGSITDRVKEVKSILNFVGGTNISDNLIGAKWSKLLLNASLSGLSAALNCTFGEVLNNEIAVSSAANIADETIRVGHALNVKFLTEKNTDYNELTINEQADLEKRIEFFRTEYASHSLLKASMLQDLEKAKKTEIDFINGVVLKKGKELGIETPFNAMVVKLVKEAEQKQIVPEITVNIDSFKALLLNTSKI